MLSIMEFDVGFQCVFPAGAHARRSAQVVGGKPGQPADGPAETLPTFPEAQRGGGLLVG